MDGWTQDLPLLPGYYWVRIKGHHRSIRVEEGSYSFVLPDHHRLIVIDMRDGVPMVLHEEPREPGQEPQAPWWMPLTQEYAHEDEAAFWGPLMPPE